MRLLGLQLFTVSYIYEIKLLTIVKQIYFARYVAKNV